MCRTKKRVYTLKAFVPETGEYINEEFNRVIDMCNKYSELLNLTVRRTDGVSEHKQSTHVNTTNTFEYSSKSY